MHFPTARGCCSGTRAPAQRSSSSKSTMPAQGHSFTPGVAALGLANPRPTRFHCHRGRRADRPVTRSQLNANKRFPDAKVTDPRLAGFLSLRIGCSAAPFARRHRGAAFDLTPATVPPCTQSGCRRWIVVQVNRPPKSVTRYRPPHEPTYPVEVGARTLGKSRRWYPIQLRTGNLPDIRQAGRGSSPPPTSPPQSTKPANQRNGSPRPAHTPSPETTNEADYPEQRRRRRPRRRIPPQHIT